MEKQKKARKDMGREEKNKRKERPGERFDFLLPL